MASKYPVEPTIEHPQARAFSFRPIETNGLANIVMRLDAASAAGTQPDLVKVRAEAMLMIEFIRHWNDKGPIYWHEFKALKGVA